jgi:hypothetical protein
MVHYQKSYLFGKAKEVEILPTVANYFNKEITAYPGQYNKHDFYCDKYNYEVKSRTNAMNKYPTTMLTCNKAVGDKPLIFIFNFTDKIAYCEYSQEKFDKYEKRLFSRAGLVEDEKEHFYIPIEDLTVLHSK